MAYISGGVQREVAGRFVIGTIDRAHSALVFSSDAWHLRFVGGEGGKRFGRSAFAGYTVEVIDQLLDLGDGRMPAHVAARSHSFGKVAPNVGVRSAGTIFLLTEFVAHVGEHSAAQFAFVEPDSKLRQVCRESGHEMIVVLGICANLVAA